jgi:hypothetical protein
MDSRSALSLTWSLSLLVSAAGCEVSTSEMPEVFVTVQADAAPASSNVVLRQGDRMTVTARAWQRRGGDSVEVPNVAITWVSRDPSSALVTSVENRSAEVTGIRADPTPVEIEATAAGFQAAAPGVVAIRIADVLEIDSVRPLRVRFGEQITVFGVGIGGLLVANLGEATLLPDTASFQGDPSGVGSMRFWVPPPATSGHLFAIGPGVFLSAADSTSVDQFDLYEPNDSTPWLLRLDRPGPFPGSPAFRIANPALAFERLRQDTVGYDWYRLINGQPNTPYTIVVNPPGQGGGNRTILGSSNNPTGPPTHFTWAIGNGFHACKGVGFAPRATPADQLVFALARLPAATVDLISEYLIEGVYSMAVVQGYLTVDPKIGPDRFEENDLCDFADQNFATGPLRIDLTSPFADTLTIDNPYEVDWFRFRVPGPGPRLVTARVSAPASAVPAGTGRGETDLGLFLFTAPIPSLLRGVQSKLESDEELAMMLPAGDYYLAVFDQGGAPSRYGVCLAADLGCSPPPVLAGPAAIRSLIPVEAPNAGSRGRR